MRDISFSAQRGRITFIIGETGSGKTTLFKLALKSLEPQDGCIVIDEFDLREIPRAMWDGAIGVVPQEIMLLNDTIRNNILLGREPDPIRLQAAVDKASIAAFIDRQPDSMKPG